MDELERRLSALKTAASEAGRKQAKAQAEQEAAKAVLAAAVKTLKEDYGVSSVPEARVLLASLGESLESKLGEAESLLEALDAQ